VAAIGKMNESQFHKELKELFNKLADYNGQINDTEVFTLMKNFFKVLVPQEKCIAIRNDNKENQRIKIFKMAKSDFYQRGLHQYEQLYPHFLNFMRENKLIVNSYKYGSN